jgi:hypothetical protein
MLKQIFMCRLLSDVAFLLNHLSNLRLSSMFVTYVGSLYCCKVPSTIADWRPIPKKDWMGSRA